MPIFPVRATATPGRQAGAASVAVRPSCGDASGRRELLTRRCRREQWLPRCGGSALRRWRESRALADDATPRRGRGDGARGRRQAHCARLTDGRRSGATLLSGQRRPPACRNGTARSEVCGRPSRRAHPGSPPRRANARRGRTSRDRAGPSSAARSPGAFPQGRGPLDLTCARLSHLEGKPQDAVVVANPEIGSLAIGGDEPEAAVGTRGEQKPSSPELAARTTATGHALSNLGEGSLRAPGSPPALSHSLESTRRRGNQRRGSRTRRATAA